jgi:uncharacterized phage protein (TIGR01671 family)
MNNDRLQFRAWCEVPLKDDDGKEKVYRFYLHEINVYDGGKEIGLEEDILSDNLSLYNFPDTVQGELFSHFVWNNCIISDNYFRYRKFKSIEQCTGLKDKHGRLIYEGDILGGDYENLYVYYCYNCKQFQLRAKSGGCMACEGDIHWYELVESEDKNELEVIGNIHENKNLLEEK